MSLHLGAYRRLERAEPHTRPRMRGALLGVPRSRGRSIVPALVLLAGLVSLAGAGLATSVLGAQELRLHVEARGLGAVVVTLTVPTGSLDDPQGGRGTAAMVAASLTEEANLAMGALHARLESEVSRSLTRFRLISSPTDWETAWFWARTIVFAPPSQSSFERVRAQTLSDLAFSRGSPIAEFESQLSSLVSGEALRASAFGTEESVSATSHAGAVAFHGQSYLAAESVVAIVGPEWSLPPAPPGPIDRTATTPDWARASSESRRDADAGDPDAPGPDDDRTAGRRVDLRRSVTASWIALAYPVRDGIPRTELEFVADLIARELDPDPPVPRSYDVEVAIVELPRGTSLLVRAVLHPDGARRWLAGAVGAVGRTVANPPSDVEFSRIRRGFRTRRLLADSDAASAGERISDDLLRDGRVRSLELEISRITPQSLARALNALGEPSILTFGPGLGS